MTKEFQSHRNRRSFVQVQMIWLLVLQINPHTRKTFVIISIDCILVMPMCRVQIAWNSSCLSFSSASFENMRVVHALPRMQNIHVCHRIFVFYWCKECHISEINMVVIPWILKMRLIIVTVTFFCVVFLLTKLFLKKPIGLIWQFMYWLILFPYSLLEVK